MPFVPLINLPSPSSTSRSPLLLAVSFMLPRISSVDLPVIVDTLCSSVVLVDTPIPFPFPCPIPFPLFLFEADEAGRPWVEFCRARADCARTVPGIGLFRCASLPKEPTSGEEASLGEFVAEFAVLILEKMSVLEQTLLVCWYLFLAAVVAAVGAFLFFVPSCCEGSWDIGLPPRIPLSDLSITMAPATGFSARFLFTIGPALVIPSPAIDSAAISPTLLDLPFTFARFGGLGSSKSEST